MLRRRLRSRCACFLLAPGKSWNRHQHEKHYPLLQHILTLENAIHYRLLARTCYRPITPQNTALCPKLRGIALNLSPSVTRFADFHPRGRANLQERREDLQRRPRPSCGRTPPADHILGRKNVTRSLPLAQSFDFKQICDHPEDQIFCKNCGLEHSPLRTSRRRPRACFLPPARCCNLSIFLFGGIFALS